MYLEVIICILQSFVLASALKKYLMYQKKKETLRHTLMIANCTVFIELFVGCLLPLVLNFLCNLSKSLISSAVDMTASMIQTEEAQREELYRMALARLKQQINRANTLYILLFS